MLKSPYWRTSWKASLAALALTVSGLGGASAQDYTFGWNPRSGDVWVDTWLGDMNRYGGRYRDPFIDEMVRYHGAPRDLVTDLLVTRHWAPGDVYFACSLASILGRPCRYVADIWERDHAQGWGAVAKNLGIKPGSPEFHRLKKGFVPSYDRWGRPITLDSQLERDFPGRGKGPNGNAGKSHAGSPGQANKGASSGKANGHQGGGSSKAQGNQGGGNPGKGNPNKGGGNGKDKGGGKG